VSLKILRRKVLRRLEWDHVDISQPTEGAQPIQHWSHLSDGLETHGDYLGACDMALLGLEQHPLARELQYRAILNLSRSGAHKRARQLWSQYRLKPDPDKLRDHQLEENIAALGARLYREEAYAEEVTRRPAKLKRAAEQYESIYRQTASTFLGINAAVLYEFSGDRARAKDIATSVMKASLKWRPQSRQELYQLAADRAAAGLLLDNLDEARTAIEEAAALSASAGAVVSTRKQLLQICEHKRIDREIVESLRSQTVIHYTGHMVAYREETTRLPAHLESRVGKRIRSELAKHDVGYGYGSLACGADTMIVEALLERKAEVDVILPFETDSFLKESVATGGPTWLGRFDKCLKQVRMTRATQGEYVGDEEVFTYASRLAMGLAILRAQQLCSEPFQLAVWDGRETTETAGSWPDIRTWRSQGLKTIVISSGATVNPPQVKRQRQDSFFPSRKIRGIMFGDFHHFSRLTDRQMLTFYEHVMPCMAKTLDQYGNRIDTQNTWGDGIFVVFRELGAAAHCALAIQSALARLDHNMLGLPATLGLRLGLDAGAVFEVKDPVLRSLAFTGSHISRTARIEPTTPPGEVYVTEAFAALFTLLKDKELICEYVGLMQGAKNYGRLPTYLLRERVLTDR
jgi:class 3 adenylate cyclase